jgi:thiamine biosynthesis lipoprotein
MASGESCKLMTSSSQKLKRVRPLLGTFVEIELHGRASIDDLHRWITAGFEAVGQIDHLMSFHRRDSDLSRINGAAPHTWVRVHPHTLHVLAACNRLYRETKGIFDIRCAEPLHRSTAKPVTPVLLRGTCARKTGPWTMDMGGIAKGYAVDCAVEEIRRLARSHRVSGIVNAGGDLRRWGPEWPAVAVATSAVRTADLSPRLSTALHVRMPEGHVLTEQKSVSVLSARCLWSDALTKVVMMGPKTLAARCLTAYAAKALLFDDEGRTQEVMG